MSTSREDRCTLSPLVVAWSGAVGSLLPVLLPCGGTCAVVVPCVFVFLLSFVPLFIPNSGVGWGFWVAGVCCSYLNSANPAPSSHCGLCTLILCAGTRDPRIHRWVARTKVMAILLLTYLHVFE